jgi:hypothetical protein
LKKRKGANSGPEEEARSTVSLKKKKRKASSEPEEVQGQQGPETRREERRRKPRAIDTCRERKRKKKISLNFRKGQNAAGRPQARREGPKQGTKAQSKAQ